MFQSLTSPVIFAHRGASSHAPENTLAAFQLAIDQGAKALELDVQLTKDREVVVFHDVHLNRTTNGSGKIKDSNLADLKRLNAAISFSPGYQNQKIPTLAEVFASIPKDIYINIELKNLHAPFDDLPSRTAGVIRDCSAQNHVLVSSFSCIALWKFRQAFPAIPLGLLVRSTSLAKIFSSAPSFLSNFHTIHLPYKSLNPQLVLNFKKAGKMVYSYTLNHTTDILSAMAMGIDGFFTDDPGFARRILIQSGYIDND